MDRDLHKEMQTKESREEMEGHVNLRSACWIKVVLALLTVAFFGSVAAQVNAQKCRVDYGFEGTYNFGNKWGSFKS